MRPQMNSNMVRNATVGLPVKRLRYAVLVGLIQVFHHPADLAVDVVLVTRTPDSFFQPPRNGNIPGREKVVYNRLARQRLVDTLKGLDFYVITGRDSSFSGKFC